MNIEIVPLGTETMEWDAYVRTADTGSPFHLTAWKRAVDRAFGFRAHYLTARREGRLEGVLPMFEAGVLRGSRALISVPYAVYGGICTTSEAARVALVEAAAKLRRARRVADVEHQEKHDLGLGLPTKSRYVNCARKISKNDDENLLAIPRKQRRMTRQGAKHGLR